MVDRYFNKDQVSKEKLFHWVGLSESSYYYKCSGKPKGNKPSLVTFHKTYS